MQGLLKGCKTAVNLVKRLQNNSSFHQKIGKHLQDLPKKCENRNFHQKGQNNCNFQQNMK